MIELKKRIVYVRLASLLLSLLPMRVAACASRNSSSDR